MGIADKRVCDLGRGDVVTQVPYPGPEQLPIVVLQLSPARRKGYYVVTGTDPHGRTVQVPVGHGSNTVTVEV